MTDVIDPDQRDYTGMDLKQIATEIRLDWKNVDFAARPYLNAMSIMHSIDDDYGRESGRAIVLYFLSNAASWQGPVARAIKKELRRRCKV